MTIWANYDEVVAELVNHGLILTAGEPKVDTSQPQKVKTSEDHEKRGWYHLSTYRSGDTDYIVGAYGIWHGPDNGKIAVRPPKSAKMTKADREAISARMKENDRLAKIERQKLADKAAIKAAAAWRAYLPTGKSSYLERKNVGAEGIRFHPTADTILIPMCDPSGKVHGVQVIRGKGRGTKREKENWPKGLAKVGHYHLIGGVPRDLIMISEGYATGWTGWNAMDVPCAVAFDAGNMLHVAKVLKKHYPRARILFLADDDYTRPNNPGVTAARTAAFAVGGKFIVPTFTDPRPTTGAKGGTDFNDLAALEGIHTVRAQIEAFLCAEGWVSAPNALSRLSLTDRDHLASQITIEDAVIRYWGTYGFGGRVLFDECERRLIALDDVCNLLPDKGWSDLRKHPLWRVARDTEIGFDPTESDRDIRCNLYGGWPTQAKEGNVSGLLDLLFHLCGSDPKVFTYVINWLALPMQRPGAKMHTALVFHGGQGTGKSLFFELLVRIYGMYGRVIGQTALEDKFNSDWSEKKLFILADEIAAKNEIYAVKNPLKGLITGDTIRINPKNITAHNERNHLNIVFLSNERQPLVLEADDRRYCVVWTPPETPDSLIAAALADIENGGREALYNHLLNVDLQGFNIATRPPDTQAKRDLIQQSASSEDRFVKEWALGEVYGMKGDVIPFCPCLGSDLYAVYSFWCEKNGERKRRAQDLIGHCSKQLDWSAGKAVRTWKSLRDQTSTPRKLVIPAVAALEKAILTTPDLIAYRQQPDEAVGAYLTRCVFSFTDVWTGFVKD